MTISYFTAAGVFQAFAAEVTGGEPVYRYIYDEYGNQVGIIDAEGRLTVCEYDELHRQVAKYMPFVPTDPLAADIDTAAEVYAALDNAPTTPAAEYTDYDELGRIETHTDYKDQVTGYFYNGKGRLWYKKFYNSSADYPASPAEIIEYTYDSLGRTKTVSDATGITTYAYDAEGRIYTIDTPQGIIGYGYNPITEQRDTILTPDTDIWLNVNSCLNYSYDELGRLKEVTINKRNTIDLTDNDPAGEEEKINYAYNPAGPIETVTRRINGVDILTTEYTYDAIDRLETITNKDYSSETLSSFAYTFYADGQRKSVTEADGTIIDWSYDNLNRLETEDYNAPGTENDYVHDYHYDLTGNRQQFDVDGVPQIYYFYNERDQLEKETSDFSGNNILVSYNYDDNGSLTQADSGTVITYTYNLQNRLNSVTAGASPTVIYKYNPDGIRIQKRVGSAEPINYLVDSCNHTGYAQVFKQIQTGSSDILFILGHDVLAQATGSSSPVFMLYDGHDSVRQLSDNTGSVIFGQNFNYDGYGNLLGSPIPQTDYLYVGEQYDSHLDWYNNRTRYYNTKNGRFNSKDQFSGFIYEPQSLHKYLYCHDNPTNGTDPTGLVFWTPHHGTILHQKIGRDFIDSSPNLRYANYVNINRILGTKLTLFGLHRPDLVDMVTHEVYEIKPVGMLSVGQGQLGWYLLLLNTYDPQHRFWKPGMTYFPKPIIEVFPLSIAMVSPPKRGVIEYEVIDMPTIISAVVAYEAFQLQAHIKMIQLRTSVLRVPF